VDPSLLREAITNVVDNAFRYSDFKGTLAIRQQVSDSSDRVTVAFQDEGRGMTPAEVRAVLTQGARARKGEGLGVGVLIAKLLVEASQGDFDMHSQKKTGTTVYITLPAKKIEDKP
jgi:K+-sensing histidine kinase KdpD